MLGRASSRITILNAILAERQVLLWDLAALTEGQCLIWVNASQGQANLWDFRQFNYRRMLISAGIILQHASALVPLFINTIQARMLLQRVKRCFVNSLLGRMTYPYHLSIRQLLLKIDGRMEFLLHETKPHHKRQEAIFAVSPTRSRLIRPMEAIRKKTSKLSSWPAVPQRRIPPM